jgi:hypothetical protein
MTSQARRRRDYRAGIRRLVVTGDLDERMRALAGTAACVSCTMVFPLPDLDEARICNLCRTRTRRSKLRQRDLSRATPQLEPHVVYVDASWRDGVAGLAVVGALGEHSDRVETPSSTSAEVLAMQWAFCLARGQRANGLTFRTDSQNAAAWAMGCAPKRGAWAVEWVPRHRNIVADRVAGDARLAA